MRNTHLARTLAFRARSDQSEHYARALEDSEGRDCSVKALQVLTGVTYPEAHALLKAIGRKSREGLHYSSLDDYLNIFRLLGFTVTTFEDKVPWLGRFLVLTNNHAAALVDGHFVNGRGTGGILHVFRIEKRG